MKRITKKQERDFAKALYKISMMGSGMKENMIDWQNIGKNAVWTAKEALKERCKTCGK